MTNSEYIAALLSVASVSLSKGFLDAEMAQVGIDPDGEFTDPKKPKELLYNLIPVMLLTPSNVSGGGYSLSYDKDALIAYYRLLAKELGKPDLLQLKIEPGITDISNAW